MYLAVDRNQKLSETCKERNAEKNDGFLVPCIGVYLGCFTEVCAEYGKLLAEFGYLLSKILSET